MEKIKVGIIGCGGIGRGKHYPSLKGMDADLPGGNFEQIVTSIRDVLFTLPPTTQVFTGHGPSTTIEYEQKYNPYI